jgi:hypothetical protein
VAEQVDVAGAPDPDDLGLEGIDAEPGLELAAQHFDHIKPAMKAR